MTLGNRSSLKQETEVHLPLTKQQKGWEGAMAAQSSIQRKLLFVFQQRKDELQPSSPKQASE